MTLFIRGILCGSLMAMLGMYLWAASIKSSCESQLYGERLKYSRMVHSYEGSIKYYKDILKSDYDRYLDTYAELGRYRKNEQK